MTGCLPHLKKYSRITLNRSGFSLAPFRGSANPTVRAKLRVELLGERAFVASGKIGLDVFALAHARDGRLHVGIVQDEAQRHFRKRHPVAQKRHQRFSTRDAGFEIVWNEVGAAPVSLGPGAFERERAGKRTLVEGHARDDRDIFFAAGGEKLVLWVLVENVVNDLNGIDDAGPHGANAVGRLPAIEAEAEGANLAAGAQFFDRSGNALIVEPNVLPGVQLNEIERFDAEIFEALIDVLEDVVGRVAVVERIVGAGGPAAVLRRNFGGDVKLLVRAAAAGVPAIRAENFSKQLFAVALAVSPRGVKKITTEVDSALQRIERFFVVGAAPAGHTPHAVTYFADVPSSAAKTAVAHERLS